MHELIGYIQRIDSFALCFIALLSHHHAPSVHKCRLQYSGTDTEKAVFHFVCIMRFCKKKKLKSANVYAPINFIFWKFCAIIFPNVSYETSGDTGSKRGSKNAVIGPFSPFGSYFVHTMGRLSLKQPKNPSKSRFLAFFRSDFWSFLRKILSEIVWEAFLKGQKSPILPKNSRFLACACRFFRFFQDFFGGFYSSQNGSKRPEKSPF